MSVDFLVKLRDGANMIVDACEEYLETMRPKETRGWTWDPFKISWDKKGGAHGPYEKCSGGDHDYKALIEDLKAHQGKLLRDGVFYWLFVDQISVGRKERRC
jgi:hypothetical protein